MTAIITGDESGKNSFFAAQQAWLEARTSVAGLNAAGGDLPDGERHGIVERLRRAEYAFAEAHAVTPRQLLDKLLALEVMMQECVYGETEISGRHLAMLNSIKVDAARLLMYRRPESA